jgi:hypothetical protein
MIYHRWTRTEFERAVAMKAGGASYRQIADALDLPYDSVRKALKHNKGRSFGWTPEEDAVLRAHPSHSSHQLARLLPERTARSIRNRRLALGLEVTPQNQRHADLIALAQKGREARWGVPVPVECSDRKFVRLVLEEAFRLRLCTVEYVTASLSDYDRTIAARAERMAA